ncbi:phosphate signaling complex protein PhoU [Cuneatibacter caecimuris]|uniref:Phosphate-specific transport system accessory protein PhoU n=1 Tax=Cuneatibacter caecimuris TaxID=1796618 RepID=A0A4Q7NYU4_9FIRM|nr:phosphate signaling complex protein PhoU [Cuneatibacter caecimuris]RZS92417.1 phosphate transport system protein [Cuneatibacter caecimuris]
MKTRISFEQELQEMNEELAGMGEMVVGSIQKTFRAFAENDRELAAGVIERDRAVNEAERSIESRCLMLMLRQQPVAGDLRHISMALKVVTDLERIGDHAADIAELVLRLNSGGSQKRMEVLAEMVNSVQAMLQDAVDAFIRKDQLLAEQVERQDDVIDDFFNQVKEEVIKLLKEDRESPDRAVDLLMFAKYLERIGDHAVNVCEWTEFYDTGELKHHRIL